MENLSPPSYQQRENRIMNETKYEYPPELTNELLQGIINDCHNSEPIHFEVLPYEAYMILALMQTAIAKLQIPEIENVSEFGKKFIDAFCDCQKENFPNICRSLELGWLPAYQMTREEFDDLVYEDDREDCHNCS
jgi:hypothetical protein